MKKIGLFVVDGQNDFCNKATGSLYVEGAQEEAVKVAEMIKRLEDPSSPNGHKIYELHATLDSHHHNDCSHNIAWHNEKGETPPPFTIVTHEDIKQRKWFPKFRFGVWNGKAVSSYDWALHYTEELEKTGRSILCLWPVHCQIGTPGSCVYPALSDAYDRWSEVTGKWLNYISKGHWQFSEHYSGLRADVEDPTRPETQINSFVIASLEKLDQVLWVGWAGSHCLRWTALDAMNYFQSGKEEFFKKSVFFEDASAAVPDIPGAAVKFSEWRKSFLDMMDKNGSLVTTTTEFMK